MAKKSAVGVFIQNEDDFEIVIVDDDLMKTQLIAPFQGQFKLPIVHVWQ